MRLSPIARASQLSRDTYVYLMDPPASQYLRHDSIHQLMSGVVFHVANLSDPPVDLTAENNAW